VIGDLPLKRLNVSHVEAVLAAVPGSAGTRHRVLATLRAALNAAVKQRQITWNHKRASSQVRLGGAGGARTHDRRIMSPPQAVEASSSSSSPVAYRHLRTLQM
jgi:hypothetical protein